MAGFDNKHIENLEKELINILNNEYKNCAIKWKYEGSSIIKTEFYRSIRIRDLCNCETVLIFEKKFKFSL